MPVVSSDSPASSMLLLGALPNMVAVQISNGHESQHENGFSVKCFTRSIGEIMINTEARIRLSHHKFILFMINMSVRRCLTRL